MTPEQIKETLRLHAMWVRGEVGGVRADLSRANLSRADLSRANLSRADLSRAYLFRADLSRAYLFGADLSGADLSGAYLFGADLSGASHDEKTIWPAFQICPESGSFIGYKKLQDNRIAKLQIPAKAKRVSTPIGRKCRAEFVKVLEIIDLNGNKCTEGRSTHSGALYTVGQTFKPDSFDPNFLVECTNGVHFFITKKEAEQYS
jgi:uncharacterized protein YjbI with pentapeptide repeats